MPRTSQIDQLGIGALVYELYDELGAYTKVSAELIQQGFDVSADQVRNYIGNPQSGVSADSYEEVVGWWGVPDLKPHSIFDVYEIMQDNYEYTLAIMRQPASQNVALAAAKEVRATVESFVKIEERMQDVASLIQFKQDVVEVTAESDAELETALRRALEDEGVEDVDAFLEKFGFSIRKRLVEKVRERRALQVPSSARKILGD